MSAFHNLDVPTVSAVDPDLAARARLLVEQQPDADVLLAMLGLDQ